MPKQPSTASGAMPSKPASRRSVWGCLTCRRRKVKCQSRETPCEACRRLRLTCTPSFNSNFKQWRVQQPEAPQPQPSTPAAQSPASPARRERPVQVPLPGGHQSPQPPFDSHPPAPSPLAGDILSQSSQDSNSQQPGLPSPDVWEVTSRQPWDAATPMLNDNYGGYTSPLFYPAAPALPPYLPEADDRYQYEDDGIPGLATGNGSNQQQEPLQRTSGPFVYGFNYMPQEQPAVLPNMAMVGPNGNDRNMWNSSSSNYHNQYPVASVRSLSPRLDDDHSLVLYYKRHLASFFSVKSSQSASWNFYSFAIRSSENQPDSPLRHSILAWTSAHLILRNQASLGHTQYRHYARARADADDLREELEIEAGRPDRSRGPPSSPSSSSSSSSSLSKKLRMLLSTSLFLSYCDVMSGDSAALAHELANIKQLLESNWPRFQEALGPLEARILVWLAYLDLRSSLWTAASKRAIADDDTEDTPSSTSRPGSDKPQKNQSGGGLLFQFLMSNSDVGTLRSLSSSSTASWSKSLRGSRDRYYLTECFGAALPQQELQDDLIQEPAKILSDQIMAVVATLCEFEAWDDGMETNRGKRTATEEALVQELREAKVQAIRANIARIQAEAKVVHADLLRASSGPEHVVRTEFHRLVTMAMCLSAIILLNRIVCPRVRTDDESQEAARTIVRIARKLRESGYLCTPRSLVWPLPVFVAGIEVTDRIYQDWVLNYLLEVASWGTSTKRARELLRRILARQEAQGARVKVRDVICEFGGEGMMI